MVKFAQRALLAGVVSLALSSVATAQLPPDISLPSSSVSRAPNGAGRQVSSASLGKCATKCQRDFFKGRRHELPGWYGGLLRAVRRPDGPVRDRRRRPAPHPEERGRQSPARPSGRPVIRRSRSGSTARLPRVLATRGSGGGPRPRRRRLRHHARGTDRQPGRLGLRLACSAGNDRSDDGRSRSCSCSTPPKVRLEASPRSVSKCFDKCFRRTRACRRSSRRAVASRTRFSPNDAATQTCINTASGKTRDRRRQVSDADAGVAIGTM